MNQLTLIEANLDLSFKYELRLVSGVNPPVNLK